MHYMATAAAPCAEYKLSIDVGDKQTDGPNIVSAVKAPCPLYVAGAY